MVLGQPTKAPQHINNSVKPVASTRVETTVAQPKPQEKLQTPVEQPKPVVPERPVEPAPAPKPAPVQQQLPTNKTDLMRLAGIPESDYSHVDYIVSKESSWNHQAVNASSGATGLCQSLPASKMASEGADYLTNPVTQLKWCHKYATGRYGSWYSAFAFWQSNRWW